MKQIIFSVSCILIILALSIYIIFSGKAKEPAAVKTVIITTTAAESITVTPDTENKDSQIKNTETSGTSVSVSLKEAVKFPINLNTATKEELMLVPEIGDVISDRIIAYRKNSEFKTLSELMEVNGIGEKTFQTVKSYFYVEEKSNQITGEYSSAVSSSTKAKQKKKTTTSSATTKKEQLTTVSTEIIRLNLNTATKEEFMQLPGIDEKLAQNIINLRITIDYFSHPYELLYAEGFSEKLVASIIDYVYVE